MVSVPKVNDDSTMTSVRRMVSAIAGVSLNHRFLEHISRTGYFLLVLITPIPRNRKIEIKVHLWIKLDILRWRGWGGGGLHS